MTESTTFDVTRPLEPKGEKCHRLIAQTKELPAISTVVVHPCDRTSLEGAVDAAKAEIIVPILVGERQRI